MSDRAWRVEASVLCRLGLVLALLAGAATGQGLDPPQGEPDDPLQFGQWLGPWNLEQLINPGLPPGAPANDDLRDWGESAHGVVLPPREAGEKSLVLMVSRRKDGPECNGNGGDVSSKAFLLDPDDPMALETMVVNGLSGSIDLGARDPFCGGHVLTGAGDVFWTSGTNVAAEADDCTGTAHGHEYAYLVAWNYQTHAWEWLPAGVMGDPRWYATVTTLNDGRKMISGHTNQPTSSPPADQTREYVTVSGTTVTWQTPLVTLPNDRWLNCLTDPPNLSLGDYPHLTSFAASGCSGRGARWPARSSTRCSSSTPAARTKNAGRTARSPARTRSSSASTRRT